MSNPHVRIILESLQELELIAQELRDSSIALSFRFNQLTEFNKPATTHRISPAKCPEFAGTQR